MYGDVRLTKKSLDDFGYHTQWYLKVTVLKNKVNEQYLQFLVNFEVSKILSKYTFYCLTKDNQKTRNRLNRDIHYQFFTKN